MVKTKGCRAHRQGPGARAAGCAAAQARTTAVIGPLSVMLAVRPDDMLCAMDTRQFWTLIEDARALVADPADGEAIAALAAVRLSAFPREEIVAARRVLSGLMAASYRNSLWRPPP